MNPPWMSLDFRRNMGKLQVKGEHVSVTQTAPSCLQDLNPQPVNLTT